MGAALLIWLWKVPVTKTVEAMKKSGSSTFEAYTVIVILLIGAGAAIYMINSII